MYKLWYNVPTDDWMEGLPLGNGIIAAMCVNQRDTDRLALNHEGLWRGCNKERTVDYVADKLPQLRELIDDKKFYQATEFANKYWAGNGGISGVASRVDSYQPAGDFLCEFVGDVDFVQRSLDIESGVVTVVRDVNDEKVTTKSIVDCVNNIFLYSANSDSKFSANISLSRKADDTAVITSEIQENTIELNGEFIGGIDFNILLKLHTDGAISICDTAILVENSTYINVAINIGVEEKAVCEIPDFERCFAQHKKKFQEQMGKLNFSICENFVDDIPTNERVIEAKSGVETHNYISELYFHYGRYLLISSSLCGRLPANLQGIWNDELNPPWQCDYHFDINVQMCYWAAESCNMPSCLNALFTYVESFYESGAEIAKKLYNCKGVYLPLQSDCWGMATPESWGWAVWIGAAPWIAWHFWQHYIYNGDKEFLKERAYPFFTKVAEFYEDYLVKNSDGKYDISPSQSPENRFEGMGDYPVSIVKNSSMDVQLATDLLNYAIKSAAVLNVDCEKVEKWQNILNNLPPLGVDSRDRLLEWDREYAEVEPGHRHLSHLYGLYPSDILLENDALYAPAVNSLHSRINQGGGHTGWSRAWSACLFARIGEKEQFYSQYTGLIKDFSTASLLDLHPPRIFQIDGNLGAVAAAIEAIVSCHNDRVYLMRSVPKQWKNGSLEGVKVVGGHIINIKWKDGEICHLSIKFGFENSLSIVMPNGEIKVYKGRKDEIVNVM